MYNYAKCQKSMGILSNRIVRKLGLFCGGWVQKTATTMTATRVS